MKKLFLAGLLAFATSAWAWTPSQSVSVIVPFPPGGSTDIIGRIVVDGLKAQGIDAVVVNKPGAGGVIGTKELLSAKADGHTLLLTGTAFLFNNLENKPGAGYDIVNGVSYVGLIGTVPNHIYTKKDLGVNNLGDMLSEIKKGRSYTWGVTNSGAEFTVKLIAKQLGIDLRIVPYKGSAPAIQDLMGGHIDIVIDSGSSKVAHGAKEGGQIKLLASLEVRDSIDTVNQHLPGVVTRSWFGLSLPPGTDPKVIEFYNQRLNKVLADPAHQSKLTDLFVQIKPGTPSDFQTLVKDDFVRYKK